jgi:hypothetical protein
MADSENSAREPAAELRITRVSGLSDHDLIAVVTYLLAKHPDTFPPMLDDALSAVSPKAGGGTSATEPNSGSQAQRQW